MMLLRERTNEACAGTPPLVASALDAGNTLDRDSNRTILITLYRNSIVLLITRYRGKIFVEMG